MAVADEYVVELPLPEGEVEYDGEILSQFEAVCVVVIVADTVLDTEFVNKCEIDPLLLLKPVLEVVEQPLFEGKALAVAEQTFGS